MNKLTQKEFDAVIESLASMISWGEGGCFTKDDGSGELDNRKMSIAKKALAKLQHDDTKR